MNKKKNTQHSGSESPGWFGKEDLQDLAKMGGDFLKKTVSSKFDALKEASEQFPKDASNMLKNKQKLLLKGLSQQSLQNLVSFAIGNAFNLASQYRLEFSVRIRKNDDSKSKKDKVKAD